MRRWADDNGVPLSFHKRKKGHPYALVEYGGQEAKVTFAGSPSDGRRAAKNALAELRRTVSNLGFTTTQETEDMTRMGAQPLSKFDAVSASKGAASPAVTKVLRGFVVPAPPKEFWGKKLPAGRGAPEEVKAFSAARKKFVHDANEAGASYGEITKALNANGSAIPSEKRTMTMKSRHRRALGLTKKRAAAPIAETAPVVSATPAPVSPKPSAEMPDMVAEILAVVSRHMGKLQEKADKWDAIKDLIKGDV